MSTNLPAFGSKYPKRGVSGLCRADRTTVTLQGVDIHVDYFVVGAWLEATNDDPAEAPTCDVQMVEIGGVNVTRLLRDTRLMEEIEERVDAQLRGDV